MEAYTSFAQVYDTFMDNVPYEDWSDRIRTILRQYGITGGLALDLGCGTGKMTELLAEAGFDMIGVDNSEDMLELAMEKRLVSGHDILYLLQDMQEFELYGTVGAIVSVCDSINYITDEEELLEVFRLANNYLDPHGIFLFDFNTEYKYREILELQMQTTLEQYYMKLLKLMKPDIDKDMPLKWLARYHAAGIMAVGISLWDEEMDEKHLREKLPVFYQNLF